MESFVLVILGVTSNLARIKLIPALYDLQKANLLPDNFAVLGVARGEKTDEEIRTYVKEVLHEKNHHHQHGIDETVTNKLLTKVHYLSGNLENANFYPQLDAHLNQLSKLGYTCENRIYYLATYPNLYEKIFANFKKQQSNNANCGWSRIMVEKPIGTDRNSSQKLNQLIGNYYQEDQIFRLDHYLGKETMQNILAFRFANGLFEPLLNHAYVDHIQITATEDFSVGERGAYYDTIGALKDVGQNHLLQMLVFATMENPRKWNNENITKERINLLKQINADQNSLVLGQYAGYLDEPAIAKNSTADTFFAFKAAINSPRWQNVPIYLRGGKKLKQTVTEISVVFKPTTSNPLGNLTPNQNPTALIFRIQPNEGIVLKLMTKKAQHELALEETYMQYCYHDYSMQLPDPYERLIHDAFHGDQTFFVDAPEVEEQWRIIDPLLQTHKPPMIYEPDSWGPADANQMIESDGRKWLTPSLAFCRM